MLLQVISTIDSKYQSTHILALLKEKHSYAIYKYCLIFNYLLLLIYFAINYYCYNTVIIQSIIIAIFITLSFSLGVLLWLFKDINTFLSASSLEKYFDDLFNKEKDKLS